MRSVLAMALTLAPWTLIGCSDTEGPDPAPHADVTDGNSDVRLVERGQADLLLWASNQSFDDPKVRLTIAVDGVTVVDGDFYVEGQHNWVSYALSLPPGDHEVTATSDSGATLSESFQVPSDKVRYAVIDYWGEDDSADLTWLFQRQPVAFA